MKSRTPKESEEGLKKKCLPVDEYGLDMDPSYDRIPASGLEYLLHVRQEEAKTPHIMVATHLPTFQPVSVSIPKEEKMHVAQHAMLPTVHWANDFVADFEWLRKLNLHASQSLKRPHMDIPKLTDEKAWKEFCFGTQEKEGHFPTCAILRLFDQRTQAKVLVYHIRWIQSNDLQKQQLEWIMALLSIIDRDLMNSETMSQLRTLVRKLKKYRSTLTLIETSDERLILCNMLIVIVSQCFGQLDLKDLYRS